MLRERSRGVFRKLRVARLLSSVLYSSHHGVIRVMAVMVRSWCAIIMRAAPANMPALQTRLSPHSASKKQARGSGKSRHWSG